MALSSEWALGGPDFTPSPTLGLDHPLPPLPCMAAKLNTRLFTRDENCGMITEFASKLTPKFKTFSVDFISITGYICYIRSKLHSKFKTQYWHDDDDDSVTDTLREFKFCESKLIQKPWEKGIS